jgi:hypothetical protein
MILKNKELLNKQARVQKENANYLNSIYEQQKDALANQALRRVKNMKELITILSKMSTEFKKVEFRKHQLQCITIGYGLKKFEKKWTKKGDKYQCTSVELTELLIEAWKEISTAAFNASAPRISELPRDNVKVTGN